MNANKYGCILFFNMKFPKFSFSDELTELHTFENLEQKYKKIVFYSENQNSWFIFKSLIEELTNTYDMDICYVTSNKDEPILQSTNKKIKTFCIGDGIARTNFFLNLQADILIMTMPDLETFHIKRSKVYPVHYVYLFHAMISTHLAYRKNAFDNFDSILCVGEYQINEIRNTEKIYNLKAKNLIRCGYGHLDNLIKKYEMRINEVRKPENSQTQILLAPSWGKHGLFETIIEDVIDILLKNGYKVILRPHPMSLKVSKKKIKSIENLFLINNNFRLEVDFPNFDSFLDSDVMITDWSGAALEYAFVFKKPILYIDVPKKIHNVDYKNISEIPIEISIRDKIGKIILPSNLDKIPIEIENLKKKSFEMKKTIETLRNNLIFNVGNSEKSAAKYIIELLNQKKN